MQRADRPCDHGIGASAVLDVYKEARNIVHKVRPALTDRVREIRNGDHDQLDSDHRGLSQIPTNVPHLELKGTLYVDKRRSDHHYCLVVQSGVVDEYEHIFTCWIPQKPHGVDTACEMIIVPKRLLQLMVERCPLQKLIGLMQKDEVLFWGPFLEEGVLDVKKHVQHLHYDRDAYPTSALGIVTTLRIHAHQKFTPNEERVSHRWVEKDIRPVLQHIIRWLIEHGRVDILYDRRHRYNEAALSHNTGGYQPFGRSDHHDSMTFVQMMFATLGDEHAVAFDFTACDILVDAILECIPIEMHSKVFQGSVDGYLSARWDECSTCNDEEGSVDLLMRLVGAEHHLGNHLKTLYDCIHLYTDDDDEATHAQDDPDDDAVRTVQTNILVKLLDIDPNVASRMVLCYGHVPAHRRLGVMFAELKRHGRPGVVDTDRLSMFEAAMYRHLENAVKHHRERFVRALRTLFPHVEHVDCLREKYTLLQYSIMCAVDTRRGTPSDDNAQDEAIAIVRGLLDKNNVNEQHPTLKHTVLHLLLNRLRLLIQCGDHDDWLAMTNGATMLSWVMSVGADPTIEDANQVTALSIAQTLVHALETKADSDEAMAQSYGDRAYPDRYTTLRPLYTLLLRELCRAATCHATQCGGETQVAERVAAREKKRARTTVS